ncbi:hypothetical protein [Candidatus Pelagibacter sp.]|uniref:hypothetical protein n=1 Tax=Candidatus Pelagibacter sp. TaxID=2024849 RepID=UPI003F851173
MKPLVVYLAYEPLGKKYLENFLKFYKKFDSGIEHDLLICFKQFKKEKINDWKKILINKSVDFIGFNDDFEKNDFDIGSYFRVAEKYSDRLILFLNTYTIPVTNNWLKIYLNHYERKTIIGATGSMASLPSQFFNFFFNQHTKLQQIIWGLKHLIHVQLFPNPHIRTTAFFLDAKDFLSLKYNKEKFTKKIETNYFESGRNGISNQLIKRGFKLLIINSDNNKFNINDWKKSETYCLGNQSKLIFKDNRTEEYENADYFEKNKRIKFCWGDI